MPLNKLRFYLHDLGDVILGFPRLFVLHSLTLREVRKEGENIVTFVFSPKKKVNFDAGQYGLWFMPKFIRGKPWRLFTVAASPTEDTVQLSTRISQTDFKQQLSKLPLGSRVYMIGPIGRVVWGNVPPKNAVLVTGGIGATLMRTLSRYAYDLHLDTKVTLINSADGYYLYREEFERYLPECHFVTRQTFPGTLEEVARRVSPGTPFYISGPPAFVTAAEGRLRQLGRSNIKMDGFLGY